MGRLLAHPTKKPQPLCLPCVSSALKPDCEPIPAWIALWRDRPAARSRPMRVGVVAWCGVRRLSEATWLSAVTAPELCHEISLFERKGRATRPLHPLFDQHSSGKGEVSQERLAPWYNDALKPRSQ
jgi:hypothetical protein